MKLVLKNAVYRSLALAGVLSALGSYLYNIVFVVYASSLPQASLAVSLANIITVLPTLLSFWVGIRADATRQKSLWLVRLGFIQALLFSLVALVINQRTYLVFGQVCLVNVLSDVLAYKKVPAQKAERAWKKLFVFWRLWIVRVMRLITVRSWPGSAERHEKTRT